MNIVFAVSGYIAAMVCGLAGAVMLSSVLRAFPFSRTRQYKCAAWFAVGILLFSAFSFVCFCRRILLGVYAGGNLDILFDCLDCLANCVFIFLWFLFLWSLENKLYSRGVFLLVAAIIMTIRLLYSCVMAIGFTCFHAFTDPPVIRAALCFAEETLIFLSIVLILYSGLIAALGRLPCVVRLYVSLVSFLLVWLASLQLISNFHWYFNEAGAPGREMRMYAMLGSMLGVIGMSTAAFFFKTGFFPIRVVEKGASEKSDTKTEKGESFIQGQAEYQAQDEPPAQDELQVQDEPQTQDEPQVQDEPQTQDKPQAQNELQAQMIEDPLEIVAEVYHLTNREREIAALVYEGFSNPDIGNRLCISVNTVKQHIHNIFGKMGIASRIELIHCVNACQERISEDVDTRNHLLQ